MIRYISEMSQNVIVTLKRCGKTWSKIQSNFKINIQQTYLNVTCKKFIKTCKVYKNEENEGFGSHRKTPKVISKI